MILIDKTCKGHNSLLNTDLIFCDFPNVYGENQENALLFDRGNPCAASFRVVLQSDVITTALGLAAHCDWLITFEGVA